MVKNGKKCVKKWLRMVRNGKEMVKNGKKW
jgi:hypothetical protein